MNAIETFDLVKKYRKNVVIDHVNMQVPEGSIFGFVGENGAGKTTIMRLISGLANPTSGGYAIFGVNNKDKHIYDMRNKMSAIVESTSLVPTMNAKENLHFGCLYLGVKNEPNLDEILAKVGLSNVGNKKVKNFSLGMKQRLGIALALLNNPKLMMLDEPMNGLDPEGIAELRDLLIELNEKEHITILISSHILSELEKIATHYGIISHGKLIKTITVDELHDSCRKSIDVQVSDLETAKKALKENKVDDYKELGHSTLKIFTSIKMSELIKIFSKYDIDVLNIENRDESIEEFYLSIIKGDK